MTRPVSKGQPLHGSYVKHFRHRYGGNVPGWRGISEQERARWRAVEVELNSVRETIDTRSSVVRVKLRRGYLRIGPAGVDGLWNLVRREALNNTQVRQRCGGISRKTLLAWRQKGFPQPVLVPKGPGGSIELWSKTDIDEWLRHREEEIE